MSVLFQRNLPTSDRNTLTIILDTYGQVKKKRASAMDGASASAYRDVQADAQQSMDGASASAIYKCTFRS